MIATIMTVPTLSNIHRMILQCMKEREISMSSIALEYQPEIVSSGQNRSSKENKKRLSEIKATSASVEKLKLISDFLNVVETDVIQKLIANDRFDKLTRAEILEELITAST